MEHVIVIVLTLLQLCRAEVQGQWFSANDINGGEFSPKPISEIFSTQSPFSSTNPIVVLPPSTPSPGLSTLITKTSFAPTESPFQSTFSDFSSASPQFTGDYISSTQSTFTDQSTPWQKNDNLPTNLGQPFPYQLFQQPNNPDLPPNFFMVYQQSPQNFQPNPTFSTPSSTFQPEFSTSQPMFSTGQQTFSTGPPTFSTSQQTVSTGPPTFSTNEPTFSTGQPTFSTGQSTFSTFAPSSFPQTTLTTARPEVSSLSSFQPSSDSTFPSNLPSNPNPSTTATPENIRSTRTIAPCNTAQPGTTPVPRFPSLRIRMVAPSGSITNINVNPTSSTRRPSSTRRTTTRRPTTTRRNTRRNRNSYDGCINTCDGRRSPICASPLSAAPIDPNSLKGFPSICHMACHNSFRKNQYEMLVEGRCGRLRTRIRPLDSNTKLRRDELNKAQYIVDGPAQTILEVANLPRK